MFDDRFAFAAIFRPTMSIDAKHVTQLALDMRCSTIVSHFGHCEAHMAKIAKHSTQVAFDWLDSTTVSHFRPLSGNNDKDAKQSKTMACGRHDDYEYAHEYIALVVVRASTV